MVMIMVQFQIDFACRFASN